MDKENKIKEYLKSKGIAFREFKHQPVYTIEEAEKYRRGIKGIHSKNLFIKDKKSESFYLVILPKEEKLDFEKFENLIGKKLKFANEEDLKERMDSTPGAVSVFGLIKEGGWGCNLLISRKVWGSDFVSFHPNVNTSTLELAKEDFHKYIESLKNKFILV